MALALSQPPASIGPHTVVDLSKARLESGLLHSTLEQLPDAVVVCDVAGALVYANQAARRLFMLPSTQAPPDWFNNFELVRPGTEESVLPLDTPLQHALRGTRVDGAELVLRTPVEAGSYVVIDCFPLRSESGEVTGAVQMTRDITERKWIEEELRNNNAELQSSIAAMEERAEEEGLITEMGDLLQSCVTTDEFYFVVSGYCRRIFRREPGGVYVMASDRTQVQLVAQWGDEPGLAEQFSSEGCWALRRSRSHRYGGLRLAPACGHADLHSQSEYTCIPMMAQGEALGVLHMRNQPGDGHLHASVLRSRERIVVSVGEHIALALANLKLRDTLRLQATRDPLTGLYNRRYLEETLQRELSRTARTERPVSLVMIDLDHFKRYNDTFGHAAADQVLKGVSQLLRSSFRTTDVVCRYGGEELVVVMPEASVQAAYDRAEATRKEIAKLEITHEGQTLGRVTASMGVAGTEAHGKSAVDLFRAADAALYAAKAAGRDAVMVYDSSQTTAPAARTTGKDERK
ncbi:MAG: diguanylate cyclase [Polyangiaceae bacterium]|nr:diguanylate cyclase [Polyangiaceae bacterium]